jgi:hypothetical protein
VWEASPDADYAFKWDTLSASEMPPTYVFNRAKLLLALYSAKFPVVLRTKKGLGKIPKAPYGFLIS